MNKRHLNMAIKAYNLTWQLALPLLGANRRLKDGFSDRMLNFPLPAADLWIQAASAGEAYLAWSLAENLHLTNSCRILVTTNTRQGMEILEKAALRIKRSGSKNSLMRRWFPFDQPKIMERAVRQVNPKMMVLLETEIWPGLIKALKKARCPVWIINGRLTEKSFSRYRIIKSLISQLRPQGVLAISQTDAKRFASLFGEDIVNQMSNIKFDRLPTDKNSGNQKSLSNIFPPGSKFLVLGSIRREEETAVLNMIKYLHKMHPELITGLFPRHMHRIDAWKTLLCQSNLTWVLRSGLKGHANPGQVILWDAFGELSKGYEAADGVFVGGSLEPLGGQNFLEPLASGIRPVTGPYWDNFFWVGDDIFRQRLVFREDSWQSAAKRLSGQIQNPENRSEIKHLARQYIQARQGGTRQACRVIENCLTESETKEQA